MIIFFQYYNIYPCEFEKIEVRDSGILGGGGRWPLGESAAPPKRPKRRPCLFQSCSEEVEQARYKFYFYKP